MDDNGSCQPWTAMSSSDWRFFVKALAHQRLLTQQILQEVTQVAMKVRHLGNVETVETVETDQFFGIVCNMFEHLALGI